MLPEEIVGMQLWVPWSARSGVGIVWTARSGSGHTVNCPQWGWAPCELPTVGVGTVWTLHSEGGHRVNCPQWGGHCVICGGPQQSSFSNRRHSNLSCHNDWSGFIAALGIRTPGCLIFNASTVATRIPKLQLWSENYAILSLLLAKIKWELYHQLSSSWGLTLESYYQHPTALACRWPVMAFLGHHDLASQFLW